MGISSKGDSGDNVCLKERFRISRELGGDRKEKSDMPQYLFIGRPRHLRF
ncbi:MAG: hypothetical protein V1862_08485 [Methanobacteriota archaeon]